MPHALEADVAARLAELIANASMEIAPREGSGIAQVAEALPVNTGIYVPAPAKRALEETLAAIAAARRAGLDPVPHVAARRFASRAQLRDFLDVAASEHGARRVMLIAGDEPAPAGPYVDSLQVLEEGVIARAGIREVGISGYPEGHAHISRERLGQAFARKLELAAEQGLGAYVVTQFSFAPNRILAFCADLARRAPEVPVYVGMAGPTDALALMRYAQICGVSASLRALRDIGVGLVGLMHTDPDEQLQALAHGRADNVVGVHLYSFGGAVRTAQWLRARLRVDDE